MGKMAVSKFEVRADELETLAQGLSEVGSTLEWVIGVKATLTELAADVGAFQVQRGVALVTEAACRVVETVAAELGTTAWLAEAAGDSYRSVEDAVVSF